MICKPMIESAKQIPIYRSAYAPVARGILDAPCRVTACRDRQKNPVFAFVCGEIVAIAAGRVMTRPYKETR